MKTASYYRKSQKTFHAQNGNQKSVALKKLLMSNLSLDRSGDEASAGIYTSSFLCADIPDEDLPWDSSELDW